ncbi:MAG: hydrolase Nlp/P60 [Sulfobacillus benefaciens]|uniref:Hydrolase Nlp/P60 n=1 Tax=Sulfobacillus benefaciens TaxID=453960 RepID=A0A2T2XEB7_9FIRM|nr:MAG: hydrolase Nlp/P60 [Sulfobacillus benefaciens]
MYCRLKPSFHRKWAPYAATAAVIAVPLLSQSVQAQTAVNSTISYGSRGVDVYKAETYLANLGYYHGRIDGIFGPLVLQAVKEFQSAHQLVPDGIVGPLTWAKLNALIFASHTVKSASTASSPAFEASSPMLQLGSRGAMVVQLQTLLDQHGYHLATDGDFGPLTYAAVRSFQAAHGLAVDGIAGPLTFAALHQTLGQGEASASPVATAPASFPAGYLHEGDTGNAVATLQSDLTKLGYNTYGVDGIFGPNTLNAVVSFQRANHLPSYGLVGSLTWGALNTDLGSEASQTQVNRGNSSPTGAAIAGLALKYQGYRYVFGGASPATGFDCSGFTQWIYSQFGLNLPRTSYAQWDAGTHIAYSELTPGDLVFFTIDGVFAAHVGIYLGNGEFISSATPSQGVIVQNLSEAYWAQCYDGAVQAFAP